MFSPTLSLSILSFAVLCYPSGVAQIITLITRKDKRNATNKFLTICTCYMIATLALVAIYVPYYKSVNCSVNMPWKFIAGVVFGALALLVEFALGYLILRLHKKKVSTKITVHSDWSNADWKLWMATMVYALIEEILYRSAFAYILLDYLNIPIWIFVTVSSLTYALNHLRLGINVVSQKCVTGALYAILYIISGRSILAVVLAHEFQNILVLLIGNIQRQRR